MRYELRSNVSPSLLCTSYSRTHTIVIHNQGRSQDVRNGGGGGGGGGVIIMCTGTQLLCVQVHIYMCPIRTVAVLGGE